MPKKEVEIYTDGACSGNPGPGGWAAILCYGSTEKEISGGEPDTTNNRMELMAVISAIEALNKPCQVKIYSDSQYICEAVNKGWARSWRAKGWKRSDKSPAKNPDLWERLLNLLDRYEVEFIWVRGHSDNEYNNRCDILAVAESKKFQ